MQFIRQHLDSLLGSVASRPRFAALAAAGAAVSFLALASLKCSFQKKWSVSGKVAVITGASSGIGKELALQLVGMGAQVVLAARRQEELDSVVEECNKIRKESAIGVVTDVAIRSENQALIAAAVERFGRLDILVLNAGISCGAPFVEETEDGLNAFEQVQKTNYFGPVYASKYAISELVKTKGKIVVVSSVCGFHATPGRSFYSGSKYALHGFFESLRLEMEMDRTDVTVTMICPGPVATDIARTRVGPDGKRATTGHFDMNQALPVETAASYIIDAFQRSERLRTFAFSNSLLHKFGNIFPSFWDALYVRGMRKLGMLIDSKKQE